jgi:opacity protein-like surface antigen
MNKVTAAAAAIVMLAAASLAAPVQAGNCQAIKAKGFADTLAKVTLYAQADLKQRALSMKGRVKSAHHQVREVHGGVSLHCRRNDLPEIDTLRDGRWG